MEDATQALYMAFAVFVFVVAITVAFVSFANVREVSDVILHKSDPTYFAEYEISKENGKSRTVGLETIIPTLHKYYKENFTVVFKEADSFEPKTGTFTNWRYKVVYTTNYFVSYNNFVKNIKTQTYNDLMNKKYKEDNFLSSSYVVGNNKKIEIFSFDSEEEQLRNEPWTTSEEEYKKNIDTFLKGGIYQNTREDDEDYNKYDGFINQFGSKQWVESIGEYIKDTTTNSLSAGSAEDKEKISDYTQQTLGNESVRNSKKKRMIIFTQIG